MNTLYDQHSAKSLSYIAIQMTSVFFKIISIFCMLAVATSCVSQKSRTQSSTQNISASSTDYLTHSSTYLIGAEDVLKISVWKEPELDREVVVRPDGGVSFPLVGDIQVRDKTVDQVKDIVSKKISKYIPKAEVTVSLVRASSYKIYVLGKVNKPGQYVLGSYVDVLQALSIANGLTPYAALDDIKILRRIEGVEKAFPFEYSSASAGRKMDQNIILKSGDVVMVP